GVTFSDYAGYNGSKYAAIYAGVYKLTFSIKDGMNPDPKNPNIVWANGRATDRSVRVLVAKATLTVTGWNEAAESSTVNVKEGEGFANVFTYRYKDAAERVVPLNYILNSTGGETFYIEPIVKDEFASSVELAFESDSLATYAFTTPEPEEPDPEDPDAELIAWFEKPTPEKLKIEFDNAAHTLSPESWISDWSRYSDYLEVFALDSDSFTQTNIGSYKATLRFKSGAKASWKTESEAIKDLSVLVLEWEIVVRKIEVPVFEDKTYTDAEIDIFEEIKETYGDFVNVVSSNKGKNAGDYLLVLSLKYPGNSSWADGTFEDVNVKWTIKPATVDIPQIDAEKQAALRFNRTERNVTEALANYLEGVMVVALDGSYGTDAGDYTAHFSLVSGNYVWGEHDGDTVDVAWKILPFVVEKPTIDSDTQIVYDGEVH
ncbi:MAG: hypothetical protein K2L87_06515, partial [Clostridiales bacterium]|nr:hypothetical protein [Clostridiales bacterium]